MDYISSMTGEAALESSKEKQAQDLYQEYRSAVTNHMESCEKAMEAGDYRRALDHAKKVVSGIDDYYAKIDRIPVSKWTNFATTAKLSAAVAIPLAVALTALCKYAGDAELSASAAAYGIGGGVALGAETGVLASISSSRDWIADLKAKGSNITPADKNVIIGGLRHELRTAKTKWLGVIKTLEERIADEEAVEGLSARQMDNIAKRRSSNADVAARRSAWNGRAQMAAGKIFDDALKQASAEVSKLFSVNIKHINPGAVVARTVGFNLDACDFVRVEAKDNDFDVANRAAHKLAGRINALMRDKELANFNVGDAFLAVTSYDEMDDDYYDEESTTVTVLIRPTHNAHSIIVGASSSFDSVMSMIIDINADAAIEAELAMEGETWDKIKKGTKMTVGVLAILGIAGVIGVVAMPYLIIMAIILAPFSIISAIKNHRNLQEIRHMMENPSAAEQKSLEVFNSKYADKMKQFAMQFKQEYTTQLKDGYAKLGAKIVDPPTPKKHTPYSGLVIPILAIDTSGMNNAADIEGFESIRDSNSDKVEALVKKYNERSTREFDGKVQIRYAWIDKKVVMVAGFDWLDRDGIILPNLS